MPDLLASAAEFLPSLADIFTSAAPAAADAVAPAAADGLEALVGTGTGLAGGATGLEGTAIAGGAGGDISALTSTVGLGSLGTAADFIGSSGLAASEGFGAAADTAATQAASSGLASGTGGIASTPSISSLTPTGIGGVTASSSLPSNVANANGSASVFDTGTTGVTGVNSTGAPSAAGGAASAAAPAGVSGVADPTATIAGATGPTSLNGAPLNQGTSNIADLIDKTTSGALKSLTSNPLGTALGVGGLGYNIYKGQQQTANQNALAADAAQATANSNTLTASGQDLQKYLTSGTLPDQYMTQVNQAISDAKTQAISNAAAQGLSTDPTKNTALAATLAGIDARKSGMISQVAQTLFSSGSSLVSAGQSAAGLSGQLYQALVQNDTAAAKNTGSAIATLAAALNGRSSNTVGSTNVQLSAA